MKRYFVTACDNCGTLGAKQKRDRTWIVYDRVFGRGISEYDARKDARTEAANLNRRIG